MGQRTGYFCSDRWKHGALEHDELSRHSKIDSPYTAVPQIKRKLLKNIWMGKGSIKKYWAIGMICIYFKYCMWNIFIKY